MEEEFDPTPEDIEEMARKSPLVHFGTYLRIFDKDNREVSPKPNVFQRRMNEAIYVLTCLGVMVRILGTKIRQCGGTTFGLQCGYHMGRNRKIDAVIVADVKPNSDKIRSRMGDYDRCDAFPWESKLSQKQGMTTLSNGTVFEIDTAQNCNAGIGRTRQFFLASETPKWPRTGVKNDVITMDAILQSIPQRPGTVVISEGTPNGQHGWQYNQWKGALWLDEFVAQLKAGNPRPGNGWVKVFAAWFEFEENQYDGKNGRPSLNEAERAKIQATLTHREIQGIDRHKWTLEQIAWRRATIAGELNGSEESFDEYYAEDDVSCWLGSGRPKFDPYRIGELERLTQSYNAESGTLTEQDDGGISWQFDQEGKGEIQVWEHPKEGCRYLVSCDPATGEDQTESDDPDSHSILVLRSPYLPEGAKEEVPAKLVARVRPPFQGEGDLVATHIENLSKYYGNCLVVLEMNMGLGILELLKLRGVPLYKRQVIDDKDRNSVKYLYGFKTKDHNTKVQVIDCLALHIRERQFECPCPNAVNEMRVFSVGKNGKLGAPSGLHDDDVMACAMGLYSIGSATLYRITPRKRRKPKDWRLWKRGDQ